MLCGGEGQRADGRVPPRPWRRLNLAQTGAVAHDFSAGSWAPMQNHPFDPNQKVRKECTEARGARTPGFKQLDADLKINPAKSGPFGRWDARPSDTRSGAPYGPYTRAVFGP